MADSVLDNLDLAKLSVADRLTLMERIWDSLASQPEAVEIPQSHRDELDRRLASYEANPPSGTPWEEVKARLV